MPKELYELLGIRDDKVGVKEIAHAYRTQAKIWHPDKNPDKKEEADAKFKQLKGAYDILSDAELRSQYDKGKIGMNDNGQVVHFSHAQAATSQPSSRPKTTISPVNFDKEEFSQLYEQTKNHDQRGVDAFCHQISKQHLSQWRGIRDNFLNFVRQLDVATRLSWGGVLGTVADAIDANRNVAHRDIVPTKTALNDIMHISRNSQSSLDTSDVESNDAFCQRIGTLGRVELKAAITGFMKDLLEMTIDKRISASASLRYKAHYLEQCARDKISADLGLDRFLTVSRVNDMLAISQHCKSELGDSPGIEECDTFCQETTMLPTRVNWIIQQKNLIATINKMKPEQLIEKRDSLLFMAQFLEDRATANATASANASTKLAWTTLLMRLPTVSAVHTLVHTLLDKNDSAPKPPAM